MYEIILYATGKFEVKEVELDKRKFNATYIKFGDTKEERGNIIYCKLTEDVKKYKLKLLKQLIREAKRDYLIFKERYDKLNIINEKVLKS